MEHSERLSVKKGGPDKTQPNAEFNQIFQEPHQSFS